MTTTDVHDRPGGVLNRYETNTMFHHLGCLPPEWTTEEPLGLNLHTISHKKVHDIEGNPKVPDGLHGVSVLDEVHSWSYVETAKSQGLYTSETARIINGEGALNKVLDFLEANIVMWQQAQSKKLVSIDCFDPYDFYFPDLQLDTVAFEALQKHIREKDPKLAGLLTGSGPYYAKPRTGDGSEVETCFGGVYRVVWLHFPGDDPKALALLREGITHHKSTDWWVATGYAIRILDYDDYDAEEKARVVGGAHWLGAEPGNARPATGDKQRQQREAE
ncbi:hypothetical protein FOMPIDRAFT_91191 [Fomitopsis schrenkii]|uniref:Uncharacterized protein n=1 Tax=Fomitopsis schrenkii TaxID=2126942 RepID=S8EEC2_FOMSC|nr:hypothetical protein FOMPIDRAFT_91191 [Fomitopsis schrenkii]